MRKSTSPVWHPFTQHAVQPDAPLIARGEGAWLETAEGDGGITCLENDTHTDSDVLGED